MKKKWIPFLSLFIIIASILFMLYKKQDKENYNPNKYDSYQVILSIKNNKIRIAPPNYDADSKELFNDKLEVVILNENAKFYGLLVESKINSNGVKTSKEYYNNYTLREIKDMLEDCFICAYIKYDRNANVEAVLVYGETIIYE